MILKAVRLFSPQQCYNAVRDPLKQTFDADIF